MKDRELTPDTKWIICMWDIRGESPAETAKMLKRSVGQVTDILEQCRSDGYYSMVRRHVEHFDIVNARRALEGFARALADGEKGLEYEQ